jgi:hypothetical protein
MLHHNDCQGARMPGSASAARPPSYVINTAREGGMPALRYLTLILFLVTETFARADGIARRPWSEQVFVEAERGS